MSGAALMRVEALKVHFRVGGTVVRALDGVDLTIAPGECVGIVGESGSGKSTLARAMVQLLPNVAIAELSGRVLFDGADIAAMPRPALRRLRRQASFSIVFQDPLAHLNPTRRIGAQIAEALPDTLGRIAGRERIRSLLGEVGLPDPAIARRYPHELSGGMRQRALIAMALASSPRLLVADEPTTALDATVQLQVLRLLRQLHRDRGMALALVTHDLALVAGLCDRVYVMHGGRVLEDGDVFSIFERPQHPYTAELVSLSQRRHALAPVEVPA